MRFAIGLVLVFLALLVAGCAQPVANHPVQATPVAGDFNKFAGALAEYEAVTKEYPMPQGVTYPEAPFLSQKSASFQAGYGTLTALEAWNCAWGREYLRLVGSDSTDASYALDQYAAFMKTDSYLSFYDPVSAQPVYSRTVEDAYLGDPSGIESLVTTNCPEN